MSYLNKRTDSLKYAVLLAAGLCANDALAFGSLGADVDQVCAQAGNPLLPQFEPAVENNCFACHDDGNGGSGAGKTAYQNGNAAIVDLFCPDPPAPEPPPTPEPPPEPTCTDGDGDGFTAEGGDCGQMDCNDADAAIRPGVTEICTDGIDNNCNNLIDAADPNAAGCPTVAECTDNDGDTYSVEGGQCGPVDCNDGDSAVNPGAIEICDDGFDNNCDANADAVDATCQALIENDDEELEDRQNEAKRKRDRDGDRRDHDDDDDDDDHDDEHHDDDDDDERDARRKGRGSRDRD